MHKKLNWGIIGLGKIANKFVADLQLSHNSTLYGVASRDIHKAKSFAEKYNAQTYFGSYDTLAHDPKVDVVYIATPHTFHFEHTMMCLQNGKHVLCEKPMGINTNEVEMMIQEARTQNVFLMEGIWTRFIPATEKLVSTLLTHPIGDMISIRAAFGFEAELDHESRIFNKKLGGGSLLDIGIYSIYFSLLTMGLPKEITATARMTETGVDSYCSMVFTYANGAIANLESTIEIKTPTEAYLIGSQGSIKLHTRFHHTEHITITRQGVSEDLHIKYQGNGYIHEIQEVNQCILNQKTESTKLPLQTSLDLIKVIDTVKAQIGLNYKT